MIRQLLSTNTLVTALALCGATYGQGVTASSSKQDAATSQEWEKLVEAAQGEGEVDVILSGGQQHNLRVLMPEFENKYGVKVNYQIGSGRQIAERTLAERRMGRYTADVWIGGANTALAQLLPNGVLTPVDELLVAPDVKDPSKWFQGKHHYTDPERRYIFAWGAAPSYTVSYNTNMVKPEEIKSYWDLLDPKWKGKIVSWSPGRQGVGATTVPLVLNEKIGYEWFRRWANEMDPVIVQDARQGAEWVALGRYPIGLFGLYAQAKKLSEQGFPIKDYLPHSMKEGEVLASSGANIMAINRAPHPNAMKLFINWALSQEGQQQFIKVSGRKDSLRTDVDNSVIEPQYRIQPDVEYFIAFSNDDYIKSQEDILDKLRKIMKDAGYQ